MSEDEIRDLVLAGMPGARVDVGGDGYHIDITVVSEAFAGLTRVRRSSSCTRPWLILSAPARCTR